MLSFLSVYGGANCSQTETSVECTSPVSHQGYDYNVVQIGGQCWFAENLRQETYNNGDSIPDNLSPTEWAQTSQGALAAYGADGWGCESNSPDGNACDSDWSVQQYGLLYNWQAVSDNRGLCPSNWRVPADEDWSILTDAVGGLPAAGLALKAVGGWSNSGNGSDAVGFQALPGGYRFYNGLFYDAGDHGLWWTSSLDGEFAIYRSMSYDESAATANAYNREMGLSVRCVSDLAD